MPSVDFDLFFLMYDTVLRKRGQAQETGGNGDGETGTGTVSA